MAQLKQNEADLYTRLVRAAPDMSDNDMIVSVGHTPKPTSSLQIVYMKCTTGLMTHIPSDWLWLQVRGC